MGTATAERPLTQQGRPLTIQIPKPLKDDDLLLTSITCDEGISRLFSFQFEVMAQIPVVPYGALLGQEVTATMVFGKHTCHFSGIVNGIVQGEPAALTSYTLTVVPKLWLLTQVVRTRYFHTKSVVDIVKEVIEPLHLRVDFKGIQDKHYAHDFCVQYRESDFDFISRLMEEEGIYYFFTHDDKGHHLSFSDQPLSHPKIASPSPVEYEAGASLTEGSPRVYLFSKAQELRAGRYTLWDHCFEMPEQTLEAKAQLSDGAGAVQVGKVSHPLVVAANQDLEVYHYPGRYAQRFDGVAPGGGDRAEDPKTIHTENKRMADIRMDQELLSGLALSGAGLVSQFASGHLFTIAKHPHADGSYLLTGVRHYATLGQTFASGGSAPFRYHNTFTCIPAALRYRPPRVTPRPVVRGTQTAVVVGPEKDEVFTDKYGRVKVQFNWDREGKEDPESSCWIRVAQQWAGKRWGTSFWPRVGQEVIVEFLDGDPDDPIIIGSVYNAHQPAPYIGGGQLPGLGLDEKHPNNPQISGIKTCTTPGGKGYNELRFDDTKGKEQVFIHSQRDMDVRVRRDSRERVVNDRSLIVGHNEAAGDDGEVVQQKGGNQVEAVWQDKHLHVHRDQVEHIAGNVQLLVGHGDAEAGGNVQIVVEKDKIQTIEGNYLMHVVKTLSQMVDGDVTLIFNGKKTALVKGDSHLEVKGERREKVGGGQSLTILGDQKAKVTGNNHLYVTSNQNEKVEGTQSLTVGQNQQEKVGQNHALEAGQEIHLKAGMKVIIEAGSQLSLKGPGGFIDIGPSGVSIVGTMVNINSGGSAGSGSGSSPTAPEAPQPPDDATKNAPPDAPKAQPAEPEGADYSVTGSKSAPD